MSPRKRGSGFCYLSPTPHGVGSIIAPFGLPGDGEAANHKGHKGHEVHKGTGSQPYFAAAADGLLLPVDLAGGWSEGRSRRLRARFLAWERLRVFSRALSFGAMMRDLRGGSLPSYAVVARRAGIHCKRAAGTPRRRQGSQRPEVRQAEATLPPSR